MYTLEKNAFNELSAYVFLLYSLSLLQQTSSKQSRQRMLHISLVCDFLFPMAAKFKR